MTQLIDGTSYEKFIKEYLLLTYTNVWMWNEIPNYIKKQLNFTCENDIGCDIIVEKDDKELLFIQCKNHSSSGKDNVIPIEYLSGFYNFMSERGLNNGYVYYTGKLSQQVRKRVVNIQYINIPYLSDSHYNHEIKKQMKNIILSKYLNVDDKEIIYNKLDEITKIKKTILLSKLLKSRKIEALSHNIDIKMYNLICLIDERNISNNKTQEAVKMKAMMMNELLKRYNFNNILTKQKINDESYNEGHNFLLSINNTIREIFKVTNNVNDNVLLKILLDGYGINLKTTHIFIKNVNKKYYHLELDSRIDKYITLNTFSRYDILSRKK